MGPLQLHPSSQHPHLSSAVSHSAHVTMASSALTLMLVFACLIAASQAFYGYGGMGLPFGGYGMMGGYGLMPFYGGFGGYGGYGMGMYGRYYWTAVDIRSATCAQAADPTRRIHTRT